MTTKILFPEVDIGQYHPDWLQFLGTLEPSSKKIYSGVMDSFIMMCSQPYSTPIAEPDILVRLKAHFERLHGEKNWMVVQKLRRPDSDQWPAYTWHSGLIPVTFI